MKKKLLFVYNADSDLFSTVTDFAHKIISPTTYHCALCALTYGNFSMKREWKAFIETLSIELVFLHENEFLKAYSTNADLPAIFLQEDRQLQSLVTKEELEACSSLQDLKQLLLEKLQIHDQHYHTHL
jgi:hypothetical protein